MRKVILVNNCNCSAAIFNRLSPLPSSRVRLQVQLREWIFPMSAFCICFCCTSHLWNVRLLWSCPLTWTKTTKNTGLSKGKTSLLLLWSLLCTCLCGENQCYNFVEKLCDKIGDELGDQFNESPIIVTNIMIKFVRILVKWIGWKRCHKIWGKNWWNIWCLILWTNSVTNYVTKRSPNWVTI